MAAILIVDDEAHIRNLISAAVARAGFSVGTAMNGIEALDMLQRKGGWDAVITDLHMPGMDGLGLVRAIAARDPDLPVIMVSGDPDACSAPVFTALSKPVDLDILLDALDAALTWRLSREGQGTV